MICRTLLVFPGRNHNYRDIVCRGSPGVCVVFTAVRSRRGFARQPTELPALPQPPSPRELNSSSVIFMTTSPPSPPTVTCARCQPGEGQAEETRS